MKVQITDPDAFGSIDPTALLRFLTVNDWREIRKVNDELVIYSKADRHNKTHNVWVPISDQYSDFVPMVARVVRTIAEVDDKSELHLLDDLETVALGDVIGFRTQDALNIHEHSVPLSDGVNMLTRSRQLVTAAAASAVSRRPVHPRRPTTQVTQFMNSLRLGQTQRGSYIIRVIAPISATDPTYETALPDMPDPEPFSRRAVVELVRGLNALRSAAEDSLSQGRFFFDPFISAVTSGVSANLCEALVGKSELDEEFASPLEVSVTWSYAVNRSARLPSESVHFHPSLMPFIKKAAQEFRARNPEQIELNGWVNILERESRGGGPGLIRLYARIDGKTRAVRIQLDDQAYNIAIDAHKSGSLVSVLGTLKVENNAFYRLESPRGFRVIEADAQFDLNDETL